MLYSHEMLLKFQFHTDLFFLANRPVKRGYIARQLHLCFDIVSCNHLYLVKSARIFITSAHLMVKTLNFPRFHNLNDLMNFKSYNNFPFSYHKQNSITKCRVVFQGLAKNFFSQTFCYIRNQPCLRKFRIKNKKKMLFLTSKINSLLANQTLKFTNLSAPPTGVTLFVFPLFAPPLFPAENKFVALALFSLSYCILIQMQL